MDSSFRVTVEESANPDETEFVLKNLQAFNRAQAGEKGYRSLFVALRDTDGKIVGGLLGDTNRGWMHVDIVWIDEAYRGRGYGRALLTAAENEALRRGCDSAYLETFSFQAPEFYQRLGYRIFGRLDGFKPGGTQYFLTKQLAAQKIE